MFKCLLIIPKNCYLCTTIVAMSIFQEGKKKLHMRTPLQDI